MTERQDEPDITVVAQSTFGDLNRRTSNESLPPPEVRKAARERIQQRRDENPARAFSDSAMKHAHFRPFGDIIVAGLRGIGIDARDELCSVCEGHFWLPMCEVDGVWRSGGRCTACSDGLIPDPDNGE